MSIRIVFRKRRWRRSITAGMVVTLLSTFLLPATGAAATTITYQDRFINESFSGSDGTASWSGPWTEIDENDGPTTGDIEIENNGHCHTGRCLKIGEGGFGSASVVRGFDSSGATSVALSFDYRRQLNSGGFSWVSVSASPDGMTWTVLGTINFNVDDWTQQSASYDLTAYAGAAAAIRFELSNSWTSNHVFIDNVTIAVTAASANQSPVAQDRMVSAAEDGPGVTINLLDPGFVSDPDGDPIGLSDLNLGSLIGGGIIDNGDGTVTYIPISDFDQIDSFTYTISDGAGGAATGQVAVGVQAAADSPVLAPLPPLVVAEETIASTTASAADPDTGDSLAFSLEPGPGPVPAGALIDPVTGVFTWASTESDGPGSFQFTIRVTDSTGLIDEATLRIDVNEANSAPMLGTVTDRNEPEGAYITLNVPFTNPDIPVDTVAFSASGLPAGVSIDASTGVISGTISHDASADSPYTVLVTAFDDGTPTLSDSLSFGWTVSETNREPGLDSPLPNANVNEGEQLSLLPDASDPDGDTLVWSANGLPAGLNIDQSTGAITGTVTTGSADGSPYQVVVTANDGHGGSTVINLTIFVGSPPAPVTTTIEVTATTTLPTATTAAASPIETSETTVAPTPSQTERQTVVQAASEGFPTTTSITEPNSSSSTAPFSTSATPSDIQPITLTIAEASEAKENLVISSPTFDLSEFDESHDSQATNRLGPREGLAVSFTSAVETLKDNLVNSVLLGVTIALLLLLGIDKSEDRRRPLPAV